jgi:NitT/TauT family transport system substrate-binding protein
MADRDTPSKLGVDIEWRLFGTGPAIVAAFEKGELDLAYIGLPPAIIGIDRGIKIRCIAGGHVEGTVITGRQGHQAFPETNDLSEILGQFKGQKIGVPGKGSIHDVILNEYLERFGLKNEIEVLNFPWADMVLETMAKGEITAAIGTPALAAALKKYANGKILYPPSMLWPNNPSCGILISTGFLDKNRDLAEKFLILHEDTTALIRNNPSQAAKTVSDYIGFIDEELVMDAVKISAKYCAMLTDGYIAATMDFVRTLKRLGYIKRDISEKEIFDTSLIDKTHQGKDHYEEALK